MQTIEQENQNLLRAGYPPLADCEPAHTPGPWRLAWGKIVDQSDKAVCMLTPRKGAMNAHLIAAAPDMFDALRAIVDAFGDRDSLLIDQCKAALAKAEGGAK